MTRFMGRVQALSNATSAILGGSSQASAPLDRVARAQLEPVLLAYGDRIALHGPDVEIGAEAAQSVSLALHELATNAVKFGALAASDGTVDLSWRLRDAADGEELLLTWSESGPQRPDGEATGHDGGGFGTMLLNRAVPAMLRGGARRTFTDRGMRYELWTPLPTVAPPAADESPAAAARSGPARLGLRPPGRHDARLSARRREGLAGAVTAAAPSQSQRVNFHTQIHKTHPFRLSPGLPCVAGADKASKDGAPKRASCQMVPMKYKFHVGQKSYNLLRCSIKMRFAA
jgi:two-component sensor histidine kinase